MLNNALNLLPEANQKQKPVPDISEQPNIPSGPLVAVSLVPILGFFKLMVSHYFFVAMSVVTVRI
jgi:hypothetical protein